MGYAVSTIYGEGQKFYESINQGSMYMEVSYTNPLKFDPYLSITEPHDEAVVPPTVSNYSLPGHSYFMGSFDGFWVHKIYRDGYLVYTTQGVNQDLFIPMSYDRIESVSMDVSADGHGHGHGHPHVPAPGPSMIVGLAALCAWGRKRFK
jgi:hypothetical protein